MPQKMSLQDAGKLFGVTANAMRARAKKRPDLYSVDRDNTGKIWLTIADSDLDEMKVSEQVTAATVEGLRRKALEPSTDVRISSLEIALAAAERARDVAETDRDHWRDMATALAAKPARRWWPF